MNNKTTISFCSRYEEQTLNNTFVPITNIQYEFDGEVDISQACEHFQNFLLACGFRLPEGQEIGIVDTI